MQLEKSHPKAQGEAAAASAAIDGAGSALARAGAAIARSCYIGARWTAQGHGIG